MSLEIHKHFFETKKEVFEDLEKNDLWPHTFITPASPELPVHWHDADVVGYVIEGETYLLDANGDRHEFVKGDKLVLPQGTLHAEGETKGRMIYIVATPDERPVHEFLQLRMPDTLER